MSEVVYIRVSEELKQALSARARERRQTLNAAACALLEQGLAGSEDERASDERKRAAASELEALRARLAQAEARLEAAREREQLLASSAAAFAERGQHELATCPKCHKPLSGSDLLLSGHCPHCGEGLSSWLVPTRWGSLVAHDYTALLGALGLLAGMALRAAAASGPDPRRS